jgi:succinate dehydrogenase / fumarate reductase cytochrome b subunit
LVSELFVSYWWYDVLYILGAIFLGLHLSHGFWAAFQSLGWDNDLWRKRLKAIAYIFAVIMAAGFTTIPLYFLISFS